MRASPLGKNAMSHGLVIPEAQLSTDNDGVVLGGELLAGSEASGGNDCQGGGYRHQSLQDAYAHQGDSSRFKLLDPLGSP